MTEKGNEMGESHTVSEVKQTLGKGQDDSMRILGNGDVFEYDDKEARVVRWKFDLILLPMVSAAQAILAYGSHSIQ